MNLPFTTSAQLLSILKLNYRKKTKNNRTIGSFQKFFTELSKHPLVALSGHVITVKFKFLQALNLII
jgi:hypothetical protein